jgi:outer membrane protein TolC
MKVKRISCFLARRGAPAMFIFILLPAVPGASAAAQQYASSANNPFYGSVTEYPATDQTLKLSLDDAVRRGLEYNLGLREAQAEEKDLRGQRDEALQNFLPTVTLTGDTGFYQHNLATFGFKPSLIDKFAAFFPGGVIPPGFSSITHDTLTEGMVHLNWTLFSGPVIAGWRAAGAAERSAHYAVMSARGETVQQVATVYLRAVADASQVDNARANVDQAQVLLDNEHAAHVAGTVANLDELRARVELEQQQQSLIAAQNALDRDLILLKREIGLAPGQKIVLTDAAPYSDLAEEPLPELLATACKDRQDYQNLLNQVQGFRAIHASYRSRRWPSLTFSGYYGTQTVTTVGTHGVFSAVGTLSVPIFREAELRSGEEASEAQLNAAQDQLASLREQMEQQIRSAQLDIAAAKQMVEVARSNVQLATRELSDETDRVNAGVDTNLPLVEAQASLASAQSSLVESLFQYNVAKLALARATGVLELNYRLYLNGKP